MDGRTDERMDGVTMSLLELLISAKIKLVHFSRFCFMFSLVSFIVQYLIWFFLNSHIFTLFLINMHCKYSKTVFHKIFKKIWINLSNYCNNFYDFDLNNRNHNIKQMHYIQFTLKTARDWKFWEHTQLKLVEKCILLLLN